MAIHGLDGDSIESWRHPISKKIWICDFLKDRYPAARIHTFGYDVGGLLRNRMVTDVVDVALQLLIQLRDLLRDEQDVSFRSSPAMLC